MKCAVHSEVDAVGYCRNCGKAMCSGCSRPVREVLYCEDCLAAIAGIPSAAPAGSTPSPVASDLPPATLPSHSSGNPGVAFVLGFFPGLGAVYNAEYNKALIHIVVFASIIWGLNSDMGDGAEVVLSLLLAGFVLYMAFDAQRTARARMLGETHIDPLETITRNRPVGPIILIGLGILFLLNNFAWFSFYRIGRLAWPIILIGVGVLMFRNRVENRP